MLRRVLRPVDSVTLSVFCPVPRHCSGVLHVAAIIILLMWTGHVRAASSSSSSNNNAASSSSSSSSNSWQDMRALDAYGNAQQLQHAQAAADQQGQLVLLVRRNETDVWVVSRPLLPAAVVRHQRLRQEGRTQVVSLPNTPLQVLVGVGLAGDVHWLTHQLHMFQTTRWERYDSNDNDNAALSLLPIISQLMRRFWGYEHDTLFRGRAATSLLPDDDDDDSDDPGWARPLGVVAALLQPGGGNGGGSSARAMIHKVDPAGNIVPIREAICGLGKHGPAAADMVQKRLLESTTVTTITSASNITTLADMGDETLQSVIRTVLTDPIVMPGAGEPNARVLIEVVSARHDHVQHFYL